MTRRMHRRSHLLGLAGFMTLQLAGLRPAMSASPDVWLDAVSELRRDGPPLRLGQVVAIRDRALRYRVVTDASADPGLHRAQGWRASLQLLSEPAPEALGARDGEDATAALNATMEIARQRGLTRLDLEERDYLIRGRLVLRDMTLHRLNARLDGDAAAIRLTGQSPALTAFRIDYGHSYPRFFGGDGGVINLHLSQGARIGPGRITGKSRRAAVCCMSRADDTRIEGLVSHAKWGILFSDMHNRIVDGVDFSGQSIGRGLTIRGCELHGDPEGKLSGDGIEINTPRERFSDITVTGCTVHRTVSSPSVGLGIAFAAADGVRVAGCRVHGCTSPAGAFHAEWSRDVLFEDCIAEDSFSGCSISMSENVLLRNMHFLGCWRFAIQSFNTLPKTSPAAPGRPGRHLVVENCYFEGTGTFYPEKGKDGPDLIMGRLHGLTLRDNTFVISPENRAPRIRLRSYDDTGVTGVRIENNIFRAEEPGGMRFPLLGPVLQGDERTEFVTAEGNSFATPQLEHGFSRQVARRLSPDP